MSESLKVPPRWADEHIAKLQLGETVTFRPRGRSMEPLVMDNQEVTVEPYCMAALPPVLCLDGLCVGQPKVGDIVLVAVEGRQYLHKILRINQAAPVGLGGDPVEFEIGNNRGGVNGWVWRESIHGRMR